MSRRWLAPVLLAELVSPRPAPAQEPGRVEPPPIVTRAIARRLVETDSSVASWRARARGVVTFLAEYGSGPTMATRLVKADELDVDVYWEGRGRSRQVIRAWRDTSYLPTGMIYHRDHLAIVTDDFGPVIRVGEGDEVADAIHPLAPAGPAHYTYTVLDTTLVRTSAGVLTVVAVQVRPRSLREPLVVGTMYLDLDRETLVRSRFTFTPAAYRDPDLEDITIRLERTLVDDRAWLPYRQEIEVRRRSAVAAFPLRGVIRGEWRIDDYDLDAPTPPAVRQGPPIGGLTRPGGPARWSGPIAAAVDSGLAPADRQDVERVRREARRLAGGRLLDGLPRLRPAVDRVSDVLRVNRVQGLVIGAGLTWRTARPWPELDARAAIGTTDGRVTGSVGLTWPRGGSSLTLEAAREVADVSDVPAASGVFASLAAQEGGHDYGDYVLDERVALTWRSALTRETGLALGLAREWAWSAAARASPARGAYRANPALGSDPYWVARAGLSRAADRRGARGWAARVDAELGVGKRDSYGRVFLEAEGERPLGPGILGARAWAGLGSRSLPARRSLVLGGRGTLPGTPYRAWGGRRAAWVRLEWLAPIPGPALPLGWLGRTSPEIWVGPLIGAGWAGGEVAGAPWTPSAGARPVVGVALELLDRIFRVEVARSLHGANGVEVTIDVARSWWPIL